MAEENNTNQGGERKGEKNLKPRFNSNWIFAIVAISILVFQIVFSSKGPEKDGRSPPVRVRSPCVNSRRKRETSRSGRSSGPSRETRHPTRGSGGQRKPLGERTPPSLLFRVLSNPPVSCSSRCYRAPVEGCSATVTVKRAVDSPPDPSDTTTVNGTFPVFPGDVTHRTDPFPRSMLMPTGASLREYVNGSPSASDART